MGKVSYLQGVGGGICTARRLLGLDEESLFFFLKERKKRSEGEEEKEGERMGM